MESIVEMLYYRSINSPHEVSIIDEYGKTTYIELYNMACNFAEHLLKEGVYKGDCVVIESHQTAKSIAKTMGIHMIGARAVPVENKCPSDRIKEIIETVDAKVYTYNMDILDVKSKNMECQEINTKKLCNSNSFPTKEDIGDILFTTGTTGKSKGVMISHKAIIATVENLCESVGLMAKDITLVPTPLNHAHALRRTYAGIWCKQVVVITNGVANLKKIFEYMDEYMVTGIYMMPAMLSYILRISGEMIKKYKDNLKFIELSSAPLGEKDRKLLMSYLPDSKIVFNYGATESGCTCGYDLNEEGWINNAIGRQNKNAKFEFVDEKGKTFNATKDNPGYIVSIGDMNMSGYYKEEKLTERVLKNGKIVSSDIGYMDEKGIIYFLGREGDIINMGGIKISAIEIEQVTNQWPEIKECACIAKEDSNFGQIPKLYIVLKDPSKFDKIGLEKFLKNKLELSRSPREIETIDKLDRTFNGKIIKRRLK